MHVVITGAQGYVGQGLVRRLRRDGHVGGRPVTRWTLVDLAFPPEAPAAPGVRLLAGDIGDTEWLHRELGDVPIDGLFHLASIPGGAAEQQPAAAWRVNVVATMALLELGRLQVEAGGVAPLFVFASTIAVLGALHGPVDDDTRPLPELSYGTHKLIGEKMVAHHSRCGWVDGRSLRLPGVLARPPARTGQLSAFLSDLIREPAAGRPVTCPMQPQAATWASSLPCVVDSLLHAAGGGGAMQRAPRTLTLPALRFTMAELVDALASVHGEQVRALVRYEPDERIETLFGRFPPLRTPAADAAGFVHDGTLVELVRRAAGS